MFCLFYLAKSRVESTAQLGRETWAWDLVEWVSETVPLLRKRQSTSGVLPFLFGQVQGGIHCPTRAVDLSLRLHWEGVRNATTLLRTSRLRFSKKAEHFWLLSFEESLVFCLFYLAKSRAESTAQLGPETWSSGCQKRYLSRLSTSLVFCLFYLAKSRAESTARFGLDTWLSECQKRYLSRQSS